MMNEWTKDSFAVGTRVKITDKFHSFTGTVSAPSATNKNYTRQNLWILPDDSPTVRKLYGAPTLMHGWSSYDIEAIVPIKEYYIVPATGGDVIKTFINLEMARYYRNGWNDSVGNEQDVLSAFFGATGRVKVKIVEKVEETRVVEVEKEIE